MAQNDKKVRDEKRFMKQILSHCGYIVSNKLILKQNKFLWIKRVII